MPLGVAQIHASGTSSAVSSTSATFSTATAAGSLLVLLYQNNNFANNVTSITDSAGNSWVQAGSELANGSNHLGIYYCKNAIANAGTVTVNWATATFYGAIQIMEITGADTSAPLDTGNGVKTGTGTGTALASASFTLSSPEIIVAFSVSNGPPVSAAGGYTLNNFAVVGDANKYFSGEYHVTSASEQAVATQTSSAGWSIIAAAFKQAAGGVTPKGSILPLTGVG